MRDINARGDVPDKTGELTPIPDDDFRRIRSYLAPRAFASWQEGDADTWPPPSDLIAEDDWDGIMIMPTDVLLKTTSYEGSWIGRLRQLAFGWSDEVFDGAADDYLSNPAASGR